MILKGGPRKFLKGRF